MHEALQTVGARSEVEWIEGADHVFFGVDPDPIAGRSAERSPMQGSGRWR
jgi:hypothetical protein